MDLISRKAAIDALAKFVPYAICDESTESYTNGLTDAYNLICQLPSVQTEKTQLSKEDATKGTTFDCISRQAAIGAAIDAADDWDGGYNLSRADMIEKAINNLPSAQPEHLVKESGNLVNGLVNDCISRQAAIESADIIISRDDSGNNDVVKAMTAWKEFIKALPSAQPIDVQEAYYRGKIDGIKECTTRLKKMNDEVANGRHNQQTSSQAS